MKLSLAVLAVLVSTASFAHIREGTYRGKSNLGQDCEIVVDLVDFEYGYKHPLNERVDVRVGITRFQLRHMPLINFEKHQVLPEKGVLTGAGASSTSSVALVLNVAEAGPSEFKLITHDRDFEGYSETHTCSGLKRVE